MTDEKNVSLLLDKAQMGERLGPLTPHRSKPPILKLLNLNMKTNKDN
jgi:hypothetical protein